MQDAWRAYLELALGVTEASRKKATEVIRSLANHSGARIEDLQGTVEELLSTSVANRENVAKLVRFELDRALGKVGLATSEEVAELTTRVQRLEMELREARDRAAATSSDVAGRSDSVADNRSVKSTATVKKSAVKKSTVKKTVAKKATGKPVRKSATKKATGSAE